MRAISLLQPWALLVAIGAKPLETRSWRTHYRGPLAIHAAQRFPEAAQRLCQQEPFRSVLLSRGVDIVADRKRPATDPARNEVPLGTIVAVCQLVDCRPTGGILTPSPEIPPADSPVFAFGDFRPGRWMLLGVEL